MTADVSTDRTDAGGPGPATALDHTVTGDPAVAGATGPGRAGPAEGGAETRPGSWFTSPSLLAALGLHVAAGGHVIAALVHLDHGGQYFAFFLAVAAAQVVVAGRVGRGTAGARVVGVVLAATLGLVLLYLASRTMTLPFGGEHTAHNDRPQEPDLVGTVVVVAELLTLVAAPALLPETPRRWSTTAMLVAGAGIWVAWALGLV